YASRPPRTSSILRSCAPDALDAELARAEAEAPAEQPAERTRALEADGECNRGDGLVGSHKQSAGCPQAALLQEPPGGLVERQLERVVEVVRGQAGSLGGQGHGNRLVVARPKEVAPAMEPAIQFRPGGCSLTGEAVDLVPDAVAQCDQGRSQG